MSEEVVTPGSPAAPAAPAAPAQGAAPETPAESGKAAQTEAGAAPAAKPEGEKPDTPEQAERRNQSRFSRKIDRLHRRAAEAEARAQLAEKQLSEARQQQQAPADPSAPTLAQHDFDPEKYAEAKAKHEADKALKQYQARQQQETQKQHQARLVSEWEERVSAAEEKYEDFHDVVGDLEPTTPWSAAIMRVENGDDVAYHLGKNLKEAHRIASLDLYQQVLAIGKLSAKLASQPETPKKPSQAPAPINPVNSGATPPAGPDPKRDFGAWMKAERQKYGYGGGR